MKTSPSLANSNQDSMQEEVGREAKHPCVELVGLRTIGGLVLWAIGCRGSEERLLMSVIS